MTTFAAATLDEDSETFRVITLDCTKVALGESYEETFESVIEIIEEVKEHLGRWTSTNAKYFTEEAHEIPPPENVDLENFSNIAFTTDACNQATKSRRVMMEIVTEKEHDATGKTCYFTFDHVLKFQHICVTLAGIGSQVQGQEGSANAKIKLFVDCCHHLRNVWTNDIIKEIDKHHRLPFTC